MAWKVALERADGPVALSLSRQKVPTLDRSELAPAIGPRARRVHALGVRLAGPDPDRDRRRGRARAGGGAEARGENGTNVRVVSMPCWELFEAQPADYRDEVLPHDVRARLSIEPGVEQGWKRWVGDRGDSIALDRFGASAPGTTVLERLGFNVDNVVARATALLERVS